MIKRMFSKKQNNCNGFTVVEMLVGISIIVLISMIFVSTYLFSGSAARLKMTGQNLASNVRKVQGFALGLKEFNNSSFPDGGWGITFNANNDSVIIFADESSDHLINAGENYTQVDLPGRITIDQVWFDGAPSGNGVVNISFEPPDPQVWICDSTLGDCDQDTRGINASIILTDNLNNFKTVFINRLGLVDVED